MRCLAYLRRSKKSDGKAVSLEAQRSAIQKYVSVDMGLASSVPANAQQFTLVAELVDDGISGGNNDRFKRIYSMLLLNDARAVVCYHVDRFSRDMAGFLSTLKQYSKEDIQLWVVGRGQIKTEKSSDFLMVGIEGVVAQHQRMLTGEKTRDALQHLKNGSRRYTNIAPYGYFYDQGQMLEQVQEQRILVFIKARSDWPARRLMKWLNESHCYTRAGRPWQAMTVLNIQRRINDDRS